MIKILKPIANFSPKSLLIPSDNRWNNIDTLKGILILLVIFGHTIPIGPDKDLIKWVIYGFHMPAFLFISGFLTKSSRLISLSLADHFMHYAKRILIPWLLASLIWVFMFGHEKSLLVIVKRGFLMFFQPEYHLWFIPSLFIMLTITWLLVRIEKARIFLILLALLLATVVPYDTDTIRLCFSLHNCISLEKLMPHKVFCLLGDSRTYKFFIYFIIGYLIRDAFAPLIKAVNVVNPLLKYIFIITFSGYILCFWYQDDWIISLFFLLMNLSWLVYLPMVYSGLKINYWIDEWLRYAGQNSLWIYLLHPFIIITLHLQKNLLFGVRHLYGIVVTIGIIIAVYLTHKIMLYTKGSIQSLVVIPK